MKGLGALSKEERPEAGKVLNMARTEIENAIESKLESALSREKRRASPPKRWMSRSPQTRQNAGLCTP